MNERRIFSVGSVGLGSRESWSETNFSFRCFFGLQAVLVSFFIKLLRGFGVYICSSCVQSWIFPSFLILYIFFHSDNFFPTITRNQPNSNKKNE